MLGKLSVYINFYPHSKRFKTVDEKIAAPSVEALLHVASVITLTLKIIFFVYVKPQGDVIIFLSRLILRFVVNALKDVTTRQEGYLLFLYYLKFKLLM